MSIIILYTLLFSCFAQCFCKFIPSNPLSDPPNNAMDLERLTQNCQLVLNNLNITDLIAMADIESSCSVLASEIFRKKFATKTVTISLPYKKCEPMWEPETDEYFHIAYFEKATKLLKHFGHLIRSLHVQLFSEIDAENESIKKLINTHCSDNLVELEIRNYKSPNFFNSITKPFKSVQKLTLYGEFDRLDNSAFKSSEIFPALRELTQGLSRKLNDVNSIGYYPHLERVTADFENAREDVAEYKRLISMNPQIRSLTLTYSKMDLLKFTAENLQKLEKLELEYCESSDDLLPIHFQNVKRFKITGLSAGIPKNIRFGRLVEFETGGFPKSCWKWIDFVEENKDLEKFQLKDCNLSNQDVLRLAKADLNAGEMLFRSDESLNVKSIVQLIENSKHLYKVHLVQENIKDSVLGELQWFFKDWKITEVNSEICLEKKNWRLN